jgi:Cu+-exporting ATPase
MTHPSSSFTSVDPVCGMTVDPTRAAGSSMHRGVTVLFCSLSCKMRFDSNPGTFVATDERQPAASCCGGQVATPADSLHDALNGDRMNATHQHAAVKDPVCGMDVDPEHAAASSEHDGTTYWFCSKGCKQRFDASPPSYLAAAKP